MASRTIPYESAQLLPRRLARYPRYATPRQDRASEASSSALEPRDADAPARDRVRDLRFVRRVHRLRTLGLAAGALCVASVLRLHHDSFGWWLLLGFYGFLWPHLALLLATHSADPRRAEMRNLTLDSAMGGVWVAVMQFNLLPSALLVTMLAVDKVSVGGAPLLARTLLCLVGALLLTSVALGLDVDVETPMSVVVASLPLLLAYPLAISGVMYGLARKVAHKTRRLEEIGRTDSLTGLGNRRQCFAGAEIELERRFRSGRPATLVIADVDRFKAINDRYGHPIGDEVLRGVAEILRQCSRATDTVARYGGDEFMLVLPETDLQGAEGVADRIRAQLDTLVLARAPELRCTLSFGAAEATRSITNVDLWIREADAALYRAKAAGRDRFETAA
jgi:diguanylate cyclase